MPLLGATTFRSKFTSRSPEMLPFTEPMPCAVWHVEQENPSLIWRAWSLKLEFERITLKLWHLPHNAYGPLMDKSGVGNRFVIGCPGAVVCENS